MKGKRYTAEQKIRVLREAERTDKAILDVCREQQISEQTFHRWKREFGMMEVDQAKQLKELQKENARLKRMLADEMLGKELLKEALEKSCEPRAQAADRRRVRVRGTLHRAGGLPPLRAASQHLRLSGEAAERLAFEAEVRGSPGLQPISGDGVPEDRSAS